MLLVAVVDVLLASSGDLRQMVYSDEVENLYEVTFRSINTFIHGLGIVAIIFGFYRTRVSSLNNNNNNNLCTMLLPVIIIGICVQVIQQN